MQLTGLCDRDKFSIDPKSTKLQIDPTWFNYLQVCYSYTFHSTHDSPLTFLTGKLAGRACWLVVYVVSSSPLCTVLMEVHISRSYRRYSDWQKWILYRTLSMTVYVSDPSGIHVFTEQMNNSVNACMNKHMHE